MLTSQQEIPLKKPLEAEPWTMRRLFPQKVVDVLSKTFINPFDYIFGFVILIAGISELLERHISYGFYGITVCILLADLYERRHIPLPEVKKPIKKSK